VEKNAERIKNIGKKGGKRNMKAINFNRNKNWKHDFEKAMLEFFDFDKPIYCILLHSNVLGNYYFGLYDSHDDNSITIKISGDSAGKSEMKKEERISDYVCTLEQVLLLEDIEVVVALNRYHAGLKELREQTFSTRNLAASIDSIHSLGEEYKKSD